jgi:2-methylisocitrate lyase-like PEP mutase family enzyme
MEASMMLRDYLKDNETYIVPGVFDCIGGRLAHFCGFKIISVTGNGLSASFLGMPDMGFLNMTEAALCSKRIAAATPLPVIADADNGYGGVLNIVRTVKEFMGAGVAGIHIEDQPSPKKCAYYPGDKRIIPLEESVQRLKAAVHAKGENPFCIIARTDAMRSDGLKEAVLRTNAYAEAGVDAVFVVGFSSREEICELRAQTGIPLFININDGRELSQFGPDDFREMGVKCVLYPATLRNAFFRAARDALQNLHDKGHTRNILHSFAGLEEFGSVFGTEEYQNIENTFRST